MTTSVSHTQETAGKAIGSASFFEAVDNRRTFYALNKTSSVPDAKIQEIVERAVKHAPNAFNMQESRAVVVTGVTHDKLWEFIEQSYNKLFESNPDQAKHNSERINGAFKAGYGTVLFFEDDAVVQEWAGKMPALSQAFPVWSAHATGILQYIVWTALEAEGLGASLQHYGEFSAETLAGINTVLGLPPSWKNTALLPFGDKAGPPGQPGRDKTFGPVEERTKFIFA